MKYDLSKCNNLRWTMPSRNNKEIILNGFVKLVNDRVTLYRDNKEINPLTGALAHVIEGSADVDNFYNVFNEDDFRIIPRDPNTYTDWQVGDNLKVIDQCQGGQVMATCGKIIAIKWIGKNAVEWLLTSWVDENCELLLTDYEKYIRDHEEKKLPYNFAEGDKVLVRDNDDQEWSYRIYEKYDGRLYWTNISTWRQCIPYNEHTWHLLGTEDAYKEDKECSR